MSASFWRIAFLLVVVTVFAVTSIISFKRHTETAHILAVSIKTTSWAASELESDLLRFIYALELYIHKGRTQDQMMHRFDLLWSRVDVLSKGRENIEFREQPGVQPMLDQLTQLLRDSDARLSRPNLSQKDAIELLSEYQAWLPQVRTINIESFNGPKRFTNLQKASDLQKELGLLLAGLLISGAVLIVMVIKESKRNRHQALHDALTGLANRKFFNEQLAMLEQRAQRFQKKLAVFIIDLDNFKGVNDLYGHGTGDRLLETVAERLSMCVRKSDLVARLGGDEFAIIQQDITDLQQVSQLAKRISERMSEPVIVSGVVLSSSISFGISVYPEEASSLRQALLHADIAMYRAKDDNGVSYRFFDKGMNEAELRRKRLADELRTALEYQQLALFYQPIVALDGGDIVGCEALLRWHHDVFGYVPPLEVVSVAEQFGLAKALNTWVLHEACRQNKLWQTQGLPAIPVSVNISPAMYQQHDLVQAVKVALRTSGLKAEHLILEVTEDTTMKDMGSSPDILSELHAVGVLLALDDFGTGYSSLSHLKCMPVQRLKIDKSFVQDLNTEPKDLRFIRTIIQLAQSLDINVVAEGIEEPSNLLDLQVEGCCYGQGYLFSRPLQASKMADLLKAQQRGDLHFCSARTV